MRRQPSVGSRAGWAKRRGMLRSRFSAVLMACWLVAVVLFFSRATVSPRPQHVPAEAADQPSSLATVDTVLRCLCSSVWHDLPSATQATRSQSAHGRQRACSALLAAELHAVKPAEMAAAVQHILGVPGTAADAAPSQAVSRVAPVIAVLRHAGETLACEWDASLPTVPSFPW